MANEKLQQLWNKLYTEGSYKIPVEVLDKRDRIATKVDKVLRLPWYWGFLESASRPIQKTDIVLEIGCGAGNHITYMKDFAGEVYGLDISNVAINACSKRFRDSKNVHLSVGSDLSEYPDGMFDVIYLITVFQHMTKDCSKQYLKEIKRKLKTNGHLFCQFFYTTTYSEVVEEGTHPLASWSKEEIISALDETGLNLVSLSEWDISYKINRERAFCSYYVVAKK